LEQPWWEAGATGRFRLLAAASMMQTEDQSLPQVIDRQRTIRPATEGQRDGVCEGTNKKNDLQYYLIRQRRTGDFHGQAPVLWAAAALLISSESRNASSTVIRATVFLWREV
jgi:hypothetical protein